MVRCVRPFVHIHLATATITRPYQLLMIRTVSHQMRRLLTADDVAEMNGSMESSADFAEFRGIALLETNPILDAQWKVFYAT